MSNTHCLILLLSVMMLLIGGELVNHIIISHIKVGGLLILVSTLLISYIIVKHIQSCT
jgi:hypothetical protein